MNTCQFSNRLGAYADGELSPSECDGVEQHVKTCAACAGELDSIRRISRTLREWRGADLSPASLKRIHAAIDRANFKRLERLVFSLASMAACLAVAALVWSDTAHAAPTIASAWERAAIAPVAADETASGSQDLSVARWVVADLSAGK